MAARMQLRQAAFHLADLNVTFPGEKTQAHAYIVITGRINSQTNQFGQAFKVALRKTDGKWLISQMNAVERLH